MCEGRNHLTLLWRRPKKYLRELDMPTVSAHFARRIEVHRQLRRFIDQGRVTEYVNLALGISDQNANYSATVHEAPLGPRILSECQPSDVFELAQEIDRVDRKLVPLTIHNRCIAHLKISIGSEIGMMLRPNDIWVGNKRSYWASLFVETGSLRKANQALKLYYDREGEMSYENWNALYLWAENLLLTLGRQSAEIAVELGVEPGKERFLWPDAVAGHLFDQFAL